MKNKSQPQDKVKHIFMISALSISAAACGGPAGINVVVSNKPASNTAESKAPTTESTAVPEVTPQPGVTATLKKSKGKYPYELKLLENPEIKSRLQKLLGVDFAALKANWNVETPIEIENGILMTSGCEKHNCGNNIYYMFVDLDRDNINVYHLKDGRQVYTEAARIDLPKKFSDEMQPESN